MSLQQTVFLDLLHFQLRFPLPIKTGKRLLPRNAPKIKEGSLTILWGIAGAWWCACLAPSSVQCDFFLHPWASRQETVRTPWCSQCIWCWCMDCCGITLHAPQLPPCFDVACKLHHVKTKLLFIAMNVIVDGAHIVLETCVHKECAQSQYGLNHLVLLSHCIANFCCFMLTVLEGLPELTRVWPNTSLMPLLDGTRVWVWIFQLYRIVWPAMKTHEYIFFFRISSILLH